MNKQSACFICVKNRPCMSYTRLLHASPLASICELLSPNNKGSCCKNRARVVSLKGFWNVNKFRRRTVRKKKTALIFEEKQMHHSKSEIKGIPLFSTHWLHIHYCVNGPWIIFVTFVNSLNFMLQNLYTQQQKSLCMTLSLNIWIYNWLTHIKLYIFLKLNQFAFQWWVDFFSVTRIKETTALWMA